MDTIKIILGWILMLFLLGVILGLLIWSPGMTFLAVLKIVGVVIGAILVIGSFAGLFLLAVELINGNI